MTDREDRDLLGLFAALQLGIFEVIWPAFPWIGKIWATYQDRLRLFVETPDLPGPEAQSDFERLLGELLDAARARSPLTLGAASEVEYGSSSPHGFSELFSESIFKQVAQRHAPWRLDQGR